MLGWQPAEVKSGAPQRQIAPTGRVDAVCVGYCSEDWPLFAHPRHIQHHHIRVRAPPYAPMRRQVGYCRLEGGGLFVKVAPMVQLLEEASEPSDDPRRVHALPERAGNCAWQGQ